MASILVRQLDANYEPRWGQGQADYIADIFAVAQIIQTRLKLYQAEWWADKQDGTPLWQKMLGVGGAGKNVQVIDLLLVQRILGSPFVTGVSDVSSSYNTTTRRFSFSANVQTQFGQLQVTNMPTPPNQGFPGVPG